MQVTEGSSSQTFTYVCALCVCTAPCPPESVFEISVLFCPTKKPGIWKIISVMKVFQIILWNQSKKASRRKHRLFQILSS